MSWKASAMSQRLEFVRLASVEGQEFKFSVRYQSEDGLQMAEAVFDRGRGWAGRSFSSTEGFSGQEFAES